MNSACISHVILKGDTLQRLAVKYAATSWESIAYLNDLQYPFILDEFAPSTGRQANVMYIGDTLLIPSTTVLSSNYISDVELKKRTYGADLNLDFNTEYDGIQNLENQGQLVEILSGDIEQAIGISNVQQALYLRLTTRYGELPMHKDYGSNFLDMIGMKKTKTNLTKMRLEILETFKKDARVSDVRNCEVSSMQGGVSITCDIILVAPNEQFPFSAVVTKLGEGN